MPVKDRVNIQLIVNGKPLHEYRDPENEITGAVAEQSYVEIKAGQQFAIRVTLMAGFKLHYAHEYYYEIRIDDNEDYYYTTIDCQHLQHRRGMILCDEVDWFDTTHERDPNTGIWSETPFVFGALGTNDAPLGKGPARNDCPNLGSIRVRCFRAEVILLDTPYVDSGVREKPLDEISEKVLKGKDIKNNVKFGPGRQLKNYNNKEYYDYVPINGKPGEVLNFQIFYRTRKTLQIIGCIPRSPSPQPDKDLTIQRLEDILREKKQQISELKAQKAQGVRGNATIFKNEVNVFKVGDTASVSRGVKREREETDNELAEIAPPTQRPRVVIDLTEDD